MGTGNATPHIFSSSLLLKLLKLSVSFDECGYNSVFMYDSRFELSTPIVPFDILLHKPNQLRGGLASSENVIKQILSSNFLTY